MQQQRAAYRFSERRINILSRQNRSDAELSEKPVKKHQGKRKKKKKSNPIKKTFAVIGTTLLALLLIVLITGSILAAALTVYVVRFVENTTIDINLDNLDESYTTFVYGYDKNGGVIELEKLSRNADRIPVELDAIPQYVRDAFVYTEDARFYEHSGVDWKRTFGAFANEFLNMWSSRQGGSTITQQLIKNVTGDNDPNWDRKMREIIRAGQLEQYCTKDKILEAYLNYIGFGGKTAGIEAASLKYFGKHVGELTVAQGACLASIPQNPNGINPWANPEGCLKRQKVVLSNMLEYGAISEDEYEAACNEDVGFLKRGETVSGEYSTNENGIQSWFTDMVIDDVTREFMDVYGIEYDEASDKLYNGGYKIYSTVDIEMQMEVEKKYRDYTTFSDTVLNDPPQSAFIAMDYKGNILAVVGAIGEKPGANIWNNATMSKRQPGSCLKPLTVYSYGIEHNLINWSTMIENSPIEIEDETDSRKTRQWPRNYSTSEAENGWDYRDYFMFQALERSLNTIPAKLVELEGIENLFSFVQNKYQISTLVANDAHLSPMAVGALTEGVYLKELVAAYQPFGNLGKYYQPTSYYRVEGPDGELVLDHSYTAIQSISPDTAYIMNKMMQKVVNGQHGTGALAKLDHVPVAAKTGTTQNWADLLFVACTPDYVSGVWYGYDDGYRSVEVGTYYPSAKVWKNVFGDIADRGEKLDFPECEDVEECYFCADTGLISNGYCETGGIGYYKKNHIPATCTVCKETPDYTEYDEDENSEDDEETEEYPEYISPEEIGAEPEQQDEEQQDEEGPEDINT